MTKQLRLKDKTVIITSCEDCPIESYDNEALTGKDYSPYYCTITESYDNNKFLTCPLEDYTE